MFKMADWILCYIVTMHPHTKADHTLSNLNLQFPLDLPSPTVSSVRACAIAYKLIGLFRIVSYIT